MDINEYLDARDERQAAFARRAGLQQRTVNRVCLGGGCSASTALQIIKASHAEPTPGGGTISLEDLVVEGARVPAAWPVASFTNCTLPTRPV